MNQIIQNLFVRKRAVGSYTEIEAGEDDEGEDVLAEQDGQREQGLGLLARPVLEAHGEGRAAHQRDLIKFLGKYIFM